MEYKYAGSSKRRRSYAYAPRRVRARRPFRARQMRGRRAQASGELKFFDTVVSNNSATTGIIHSPSLALIPQGVTESERIGRKCVLKVLDVRGEVTLNTDEKASDTENMIRLIVYQDKQANGLTANVGDILETAHVDSFYNLSNSGRFKILLDKRWAMTPTAAFAGDSCPRVYPFTLHKLCNMPLEYSGTAGALTELRSNNIGIMSISFSSGNAPVVGFTTRLLFADG